MIEAELGAPMERLFRRITPRPIAAASLGQVYRAELAESGQVVAVKVQRPGVGRSLQVDVFLIRSAAALLDKQLASLTTSAAEVTDAFALRVFQEVDYVAEGRNGERFARLYASPTVLVPDVVWHACSARVLTTGWVEGVKLSDGPALRANGLDVLALVNIGIQCSLRQLLEAGYFHADPHPGCAHFGVAPPRRA